MQNNCESTYYMLIVDRAGNSYTVSGVGLDVLPDALLRYINGEIDTCTPEILYHYCDLATTITYGFADQLEIDTAKKEFQYGLHLFLSADVEGMAKKQLDEIERVLIANDYKKTN